MTITTTKRNVGPLEIRAEVGTVDVEKRTFEVMFSTGAKVLRSNWYDGPFYEELSMDPKHVRMERLTSGTAPFLADHNGSRVADIPGVVETARIEKGKGIATIRMVSEGIDPEADKLFRKIADKIVRNVSVGYRTYKVEKTEGVDTKIPTLRAVDWEPYEISGVGMGAEPGAGVRAAVDLHEVEIIHPLGFPGTTTTKERAAMEPEELKKLEAERAAAEAKRAADIEAEVAKRTLALRERDVGIQHACRTAKLGDDFAQKLITNTAVTLDEARKQVLEELARRDAAMPIDGHIRVEAIEGQDERDKWVRSVSAWAFEASGSEKSDVLKAVKRAKDGKLSGILAREFTDLQLDSGHRGMSLVDIARSALDRAGIAHRHIYDKNKIFELALRAQTGDFVVLFENVMYKSLRAAYATQQDTWRRWCGTDTVKDFRAANRYMNGAFAGALPVVPEDAEYTHAAIPDGTKIQIETETRGEIISLSRQALINDDMGALVDVATRFGRKAGRSIEVAAYELLLQNSGLGPTTDGAPFFDDAARDNVGTGSALTVAGIDADRQKMRLQMHGDDYIDQNPSILLVPVGLESTAKIINESANDFTSAANSNKPNPVKGVFSDIVSSPRLAGTRRYLFTDAKEAFKVVFLEGAGEGPTMETKEGFSRDGTQWKARIDFKVNKFDPKTALTNAGAP